MKGNGTMTRVALDGNFTLVSVHGRGLQSLKRLQGVNRGKEATATLQPNETSTIFDTFQMV